MPNPSFYAYLFLYVHGFFASFAALHGLVSDPVTRLVPSLLIPLLIIVGISRIHRAFSRRSTLMALGVAVLVTLNQSSAQALPVAPLPPFTGSRTTECLRAPARYGNHCASRYVLQSINQNAAQATHNHPSFSPWLAFAGVAFILALASTPFIAMVLASIRHRWRASVETKDDQRLRALTVTIEHAERERAQILARRDPHRRPMS